MGTSDPTMVDISLKDAKRGDLNEHAIGDALVASEVLTDFPPNHLCR